MRLGIWYSARGNILWEIDMKKPIIAIDFDDVIGGFNPAFIRFHNQLFHSNVEYEDIIDYDMTRFYGVELPELLSRIERFCHHQHDTIEPIEGAVSGLACLAPHYDVQVVTSRCESLRDHTQLGRPPVG